MIKRILIVDDEPLIANGVSGLIRQLELPLDIVHTVFSSEQALTICQSEKIDIVVTDINMPGLNGIELIKKIKSCQPDSQMIILTGFGSFDYAKEAMSLGLRFFLEKPVERVKLEQALSESIELLDQRDIENRLWIKRCIERSVSLREDIDPWPNVISFPLKIITFHSDSYQLISQTVKENKLSSHLITGYVKDTGYLITTPKNQNFEELFEQLKQNNQLNKGLFFYQTINSQQELQTCFELSRGNFDKSYYFDSPQFFNGTHLKIKDVVYSNEQFSGFKDQFLHLLAQGELTKCKITVKGFFEQCRLTFYPVQLLQLQVNDLLNLLFEKYSLKKDSVFDDYSLKVILLSDCRELQYLLIHGIELFEKQTCLTENTSIAQNVNIIIESYYSQEHLSLKWISNNLLFLNPEYIGKIYYKETGERFNSKLAAYRMEKAIDLLKKGYRVYEAANLTGYSNAPEYFVQTFKKYTGKTPKQFVKQAETAK
ncbi:response regulator [Enterococcus sp. BWT-B8]|uniref:response regulator transcription factor n=1 Tax=Enterococcus sp. BWT-B8 TaxID=2885157 RepID=UPI001E2AAA27|nr:response regulator [Enterococcus sp. BWT-B8]MCB5953174.1 response regulator [Enterococcus sp. BWT-B8]